MNLDGFRLFGRTLIVNATPHPIRFQDPDNDLVIVEVPPCGLTLKATAVETPVLPTGSVELVTTVFEASEQGLAELHQIENYAAHDGVYNQCDLIVVGSIISAQAFPGRVKALVSAPGYERKPPQEKLFLSDKFTVF